MDKPCECVKVAYHEAGHAVAAALAQIPIEYATIQPTDFDLERGTRSLGLVSLKPLTLPTRQPEAGPLTQDEITAGEAYFRMIMAGPIAEYRFTGEFDTRSGVSDYAKAQILGYALCNHGIPADLDDAAFSAHLQLDSTRVYMAQLTRSSLNLVVAYWHAIIAVAQALLNTVILDGAVIRRLTYAAPYLHDSRPHIGWGVCSECRRTVQRPRRSRNRPDPTVEQLTMF
jgi:hypothetical protein